MNIKISFCAGALVALLVLTGCGPRDTRAFPRLKQQAARVEQHGIEVSVHLLSRQDCVAYFDVDVIAHGYRPLVITIDNGTSDSYVLRPSYVGLDRVSGKEVSRLMHYDTYQRVMWMTLPAVIFCWQVIPFFIVPYGLGCRHYNHKTTRNIRKKTLGSHDTVAIAPYETIRRFMFVPEESFRTIFDVNLFNETTRKIETFSINCAQPLTKKER